MTSGGGHSAGRQLAGEGSRARFPSKSCPNVTAEVNRCGAAETDDKRENTLTPRSYTNKYTQQDCNVQSRKSRNRINPCFRREGVGILVKSD